MSSSLQYKSEAVRNGYQFSKYHDKAYARFWELWLEGRPELGLYMFLAQNIDRETGSLVIGQRQLCAALRIGRTTLWRHCNFLEEIGALCRIRIDGSTYAYALDPLEIWKSTDEAKQRALFRTRAYAEVDRATIARLKVQAERQAAQLRLPFEQVEMLRQSRPAPRRPAEAGGDDG